MDGYMGMGVSMSSKDEATAATWLGAPALICVLIGMAVSSYRGEWGFHREKPPQVIPANAPTVNWNAVPGIWATCEHCQRRHAPAMVNTNAPGADKECP